MAKVVKGKSKSKGKKRSFTGSVRKDAERRKGAQYGYLNLPKGLSVFREDPGSRVSLDIMPYEVTIPNHPDRNDEYGNAVPGNLWYKRPYWLHRNIGADNKSIVCPSSVGGKCPICEYRAQLLKEGADWSDDAVKALKPSMRNLYAIIPKGSKKYDEVPHVWDISQFLFQDKLEEEFQENEDYDSFPDLEEGYTLQIRFSEESFGSNKFADTSRIDFKNRSKPYDESILEDIPNLDELLEVMSYKAIETLFYGGVAMEDEDGCIIMDDEDEDEDDGEETRTKAKTSSRRKAQEEDDDDDDDEDEDDEDTDDDDDDDEEDEEAPPAKSTKSTKSSKKAKPSAKDKKSKKAKSKKKCPHGYKFGEDNDEYEECEDCPLWEDCEAGLSIPF